MSAKNIILGLSCAAAVALIPLYGVLAAAGLPAWLLFAGLLLLSAAVVVADKAGAK